MQNYKAEHDADLNFSFPDDLIWEELDRQGVKLPEKMSLVDFVIERETDILLVEVKDPSNIYASEENRQKYLKKFQNNTLIVEELTPKGRNSYTFLHLMERDTKPFKYVILLGLEAYEDSIQQALLGTFKDRLLGNIRNEAWEPWKRLHIQDCLVLSVPAWNQHFPNWPITRLSSAATPQGA